MKTSRPCFSNGSEAEWWMDRNCDYCIKAWRLKDNGVDYTKSRCKIQDEILTQWMGRGDESINQRTYDVTHKADCPYKKEHYEVNMKGMLLGHIMVSLLLVFICG